MKKQIPFVILLLAFVISLVSCNENNSSVPESEEPTPDPGNIVISPRDFLSEEQYDNLLIEIVYVEGYKPQASSIDQLKSFLNQRLHKSKGISVSVTAIPPTGKSVYSLADLKSIEETHRKEYPENTNLTAWFFFADSDYADNQENSKVLGVAYGPTSMTIFEKTIHEYSGGLGQPSQNTLETSVMEHEFGHILGLVNTGTDMVLNHQDAEHGHHCDNEDCLMYWAAETSNFISNFIGGNVPELDQNCMNDLQNNGGK